MTQKLTSIWHCLWGLPLLLMGGGLFVYALYHGLMHATDALTQIVVPGSATLSLHRDTTYTVFLEEQSVVNGKVYSTTESVAGLECHVRSLRKDAAIMLEKPGMSTTYDLGARSGHSVLEFPIQEDGDYEFGCDYGDNPKGPEVVVAVGSGVSEAIFRTVGGALESGSGGVGACLAVVIAVLFKREREKKKIAKSREAQA